MSRENTNRYVQVVEDRHLNPYVPVKPRELEERSALNIDDGMQR